MNYEFTRNYFHSKFGNNSEIRSLNFIELIDENTKNYLSYEFKGNHFVLNLTKIAFMSRRHI